MSRQGDNLPTFRALQLDFAAHIRDPDRQPRPADVDPRRMRVYVELFYNNVEKLLASAFPVARSILAGERWYGLVRAFLQRHGSSTPYFLEISQEFLTFLAEDEALEVPPFLLELCHYEWVELALGVAEEEIPEHGIDPDGDLAAGIPVLSPLMRRLAYRYPVHRIGPGFQPETPPEQPTQLVVYRRRDDAVHFMEVGTLTMALLERLEPGKVCGAEVLARLADEVQGMEADAVRRQGLAALTRLRNAQIVLGTRSEPEK
ncbi:MAG TPA: putative DNA-binding domain-containing protein [Pseudomonadales bacterium]